MDCFKMWNIILHFFKEFQVILKDMEMHFILQMGPF
jgi:hypothetical protein